MYKTYHSNLNLEKKSLSAVVKCIKLEKKATHFLLFHLQK
jgi:hypothetical protein